jgi:hypothetical protein
MEIKDNKQTSTFQVEEKYKAEVSLLKMFIGRFNKYVGQVVKENPCDKTRKVDATIRIIKDILDEKETPKYTSIDKIREIYKLIDNGDDKQASLYGEGVNGFKLDDVLNPKGKLDLKDILSELGVTD